MYRPRFLTSKDKKIKATSATA